MLVLGVDTSNYATSLAVLRTETKEVVCASKRFLPVREGERGLRQSDAVFHHTAALPEMLEDLARQVPLTDIGAAGVSVRPRPVEGSYMPCFLVGEGIAKAICLAKGVPLARTSHQQGHVAAALYATGEEKLWQGETLVFHISGGTTELLRCQGCTIKECVGATTDLYAGQAVDRTGVRLGFSFPAGEELSNLAAAWEEPIRPKVSVRGTDCSLSGLENQCVHLLEQGAAPAYVAKYCLSAVAYTVLGMAGAARKQYPELPVVCAGGVMSSPIIREIVQQQLSGVYFVSGRFSSDNAIGVAVIAAKEVNAWPTM